MYSRAVRALITERAKRPSDINPFRSRNLPKRPLSKTTLSAQISLPVIERMLSYALMIIKWMAQLTFGRRYKKREPSPFPRVDINIPASRYGMAREWNRSRRSFQSGSAIILLLLFLPGD